jgi:cytochrome bd-type quinol oxidase subunit 2
VLKVAPEPLTLHNAAAPLSTLLWLNVGLVVVLLLVVLYRVFRASDGNPPE